VLFGAVRLRAPHTCVRERARTDLCVGPITGGDQRDYTGCDCVRMTGGVYPAYMKWREAFEIWQTVSPPGSGRGVPPSCDR